LVSGIAERDDFQKMTTSGISNKVFWVFARLSFAAYCRFPIFGALSAAVGIMCQEGKYLVVHRSDGRGLSFPGGLQRPWETAKQALIREVREETGLEVTRCSLKLRYYSSADIPVNVTVFEIEASGQLQDSWEGLPCWLPADDLRQGLLASQRRILEFVEMAP
jgi:8-oxo-dGTP pyrophosphatase MutT (NUDIX family)